MKSSEKIVGNYIGRPQSPKVELLMQELIYDSLKELMEQSYLYRSRRIDIRQIVAQADKEWTADSLEREFQQRPWIPWSQNRGFTHSERQVFQHGGGCNPLGTPLEQMHLSFIIPTVMTWCFKCEHTTVHDSIPHIEVSPYHLNPEAIAEPVGSQNFLFNMMCQECKSPPTTFMVRREFLKVQLCGRSHPFLPLPPSEVPKAVRDIYRDAVGAAACGDAFGAFYHLRTLMEHQMKWELGIAITDKIDGDDLCARYSRAIDSVLRDRCSLKTSFDACSSNLHNRTGSLTDYEKIVEEVCTHFQLKQTLQKLSQTKTT
jgi:hypothetical protein